MQRYDVTIIVIVCVPLSPARLSCNEFIKKYFLLEKILGIRKYLIPLQKPSVYVVHVTTCLTKYIIAVDYSIFRT